MAKTTVLGFRLSDADRATVDEAAAKAGCTAAAFAKAAVLSAALREKYGTAPDPVVDASPARMVKLAETRAMVARTAARAAKVDPVVPLARSHVTPLFKTGKAKGK